MSALRYRAWLFDLLVAFGVVNDELALTLRRILAKGPDEKRDPWEDGDLEGELHDKYTADLYGLWCGLMVGKAKGVVKGLVHSRSCLDGFQALVLLKHQFDSNTFAIFLQSYLDVASLYARAPLSPTEGFPPNEHPPSSHAPDHSRLGAPNVGLAQAATTEAVIAAVKSFGKHSGAGPSGLRPCHFKQALVPAQADQVMDDQTSLVNLLVKGGLPADVSPWLWDASLMALPKKHGSSRPVAVGEVFWRLAAKTLCTAYQEQALNCVWPPQICVAQPLGTEVGLQVARQWCYRERNSPDMVFLKLDFANAFNTIDREFFLQEVAARCLGWRPGLITATFALLNWCSVPAPFPQKTGFS